MTLNLKVGDRVRYTGPQLLGKPLVGTIVRLPVPHTKGMARRATDDRVMVLKSAPGTTKHPICPVRVHHLEVIG